MGVVENHLLESAVCNACAQIAHHGEKCPRAHGEGPRKSQMLVALAIADRRQRIQRELRRNELQRFAEQQIVDQRVCREGQMVTVLLDRGRGQHQ